MGDVPPCPPRFIMLDVLLYTKFLKGLFMNDFNWFIPLLTPGFRATAKRNNLPFIPFTISTLTHKLLESDNPYVDSCMKWHYLECLKENRKEIIF